MAKIECTLQGNIDEILKDLENAIMQSSSATLEESSDFITDSARCIVRAYERYSYFGKGRVSLNIVLFQSDERIKLSAVSTGGSQAMFFKINTIGENSFLDTIRNVVGKYIV